MVFEKADDVFRASSKSEAIDYSFWKVVDATVRDEEKVIQEGDTIRMGNNLLYVLRNKDKREKDLEEEKSETQSAAHSEKSENCFSFLESNRPNLPMMECESPRLFTEDGESPFSMGKPEKAKQQLGQPQSLSTNLKVCEPIAKMPCRICFDDSNSESDPLISPCACSGSMSGIHLKCLKKWLDVKTLVKRKSRPLITTWDLSKFKCEICNSFLPGTPPPFNSKLIDWLIPDPNALRTILGIEFVEIGERVHCLMPKPKNTSRYVQMLVSHGCAQQNIKRQLVAIDASAKQSFEIVQNYNWLRLTFSLRLIGQTGEKQSLRCHDY